MMEINENLPALCNDSNNMGSWTFWISLGPHARWATYHDSREAEPSKSSELGIKFNYYL